MTREERWLKKADYRDCQVLVEEILNDFRSRTCENCSLWETHTKYSTSIKINSCLILKTLKDFGCVKFERKDK